VVPGEIFIVAVSLAIVWTVQKRLIADNGGPMKLTKHLVEKPWGRTGIPAAFGDMGDRRIGEIWYESALGAPLPILVKWLFTSEKLSIQVHPNDAQARDRGLQSGKEECWFVVHAEPGAVLGIGTQQELSADALRAASLSGEIESLMDWKPVSAGDYYYIPAGTVHAIGAGITLVEVQQFADITYRLFDYGRPRELHLDDGVAVSVAAPYRDSRSGRVAGGRQLVDGPHFQLWYVDHQSQIDALDLAGNCWIVPLTGTVSVADEIAAVGECLVVDGPESVEISADATLLIAR
jgi:mannose-6-phosphate isomerase